MNLLALAVVTVNIGNGMAAEQLTEFGQQTGLQLLYNFEDMKPYRTNAVQGTMDAFVALDRMIEGTPLQYEYVNRRTVTITAKQIQEVARADDGQTVSLIAEGCSFGFIPSERAAKELGEVPQACWCCVNYDEALSAVTVHEAFCVSLPSRDACSVYDAHSRKDFWANGVTAEVTVSDSPSGK